MKWLRRLFIALMVLVVCAAGLLFSLPHFNDYQTKGTLSIPGLTQDVAVKRDAKGMAYVYAQNPDDLFLAQGFVTAQDRLFQMQLNRMLAQGRISELAGEAARDLDIRMRTLGLHRLAKKQAAMLTPAVAGQFQKYVDGINAFIDTCPKDIHLEFKLAGIKPDHWEIADSLSIVYYMGYATAANLDTELIAQMLINTLGYEKALQIMPINLNPDDPDDTGILRFPDKGRITDLGPNIRVLFAYKGDRKIRGGSNNWAVAPALSAANAPILAGDPHLDPRILPGVWYPIGLITPEIRAVGAHVAGIPGMAIGRTRHLALAMTNNYGDMQDLYIEQPDPDNPDNYLEGDQSIPFIRFTETLKIKDKKAPNGFRTEEILIRATKRGPVVTHVLPGLTTRKPVSLRFAPAESMVPDIGLLGIITAKDSRELAGLIEKVPMICMNWVFADTKGNIGHKASGWIPIRNQGDGTVPLPVKDGIDNWVGWIPQDRMPGSMNPVKHWVGTCNHKVVPADYPFYYSSYFAASYRYQRLRELMARPGKRTAEHMWQFQRDTKNMMAAAVAPVMAEILQGYKDTAFLGDILSDWDYMDDPDKAAPAVFQTLYPLFARHVFEDELGEENALMMLNSWYFWEERLQRMVFRGASAFFDDIRTGDQTETMADLFHRAGREAVSVLTQRLGPDPGKWQWGSVHTLDLVNPLVRKGPLKNLLGSGPLPMGGSGETLYRGWYAYDNPFGITHCAALRMVADFADSDRILAVLPGGVTGRTFHSHQKDQVDAYMAGEKVYWWFSDEAINAHTRSTLLLDAE